MPRKKARSVKPGDIVQLGRNWIQVDKVRDDGDGLDDWVVVSGYDDHGRFLFERRPPNHPLRLAPRDVVDEWPQ